MSRILIVEDNALNRDALSRRLVRRGYHVLLAADGATGLSMASSHKPDLILMDLGLPDIDGWECTRRLKADPGTKHIPVIALSAHAMRDDQELAREAGCDDFGSKPLDLPALLEKMSRLIGGGGSRRAFE